MPQQFDKAKAVNWLQVRWGKDKRCPVCGHRAWVITDILLELREFHRGGLIVGGATVPLLNVTCSRCANTILFNALAMGLVEPESDAAKGSEESEGSGG